MSQLLHQNIGYLQLLTCCSPHQRDFLLATATPEQLHTLCEVCYNLLRGTIPHSIKQKQKLIRFLDEIRELADSSVPFKTKKTILVQHGGGFVGDLISPLLTGLSLFLP
jgi:hypothetical protein